MAEPPGPGSPERYALCALLGTLHLHVFERAGIREASDQIDPGLLDARADAPDERQLVDRDLGHAVVQDRLDLVDQSLTLLHVRLTRLALKQILDLRNHAGRVDAVLADVGFE